jgi:hypothetical protein
MLYNKTASRTDAYTIGKHLVLLIAACLIFGLAGNGEILAAGKVEASGTFTSIDEDGSITIDGKGYDLSPSATVQNYKGERISLSELLPSRFVHFEYEYTTRGFVIFFIKEIPQ